MRQNVQPSHALFIIAGLTFREAARRKILLVALILGLIFMAVYGAGLYYITLDLERTGQMVKTLVVNQVFNFLLLSGLYVVNFLYVVITVLTTVDTLSGEITTGTILALAAKPIRRWEILLGKWLGFTVMLSCYLLFMAGGVLLLVHLITDYTINNVMAGLVLIWINGVLILNLTLLGGTRLSTMANGVFVFASYGIAFVGGWIEQVGSFLENKKAMNIGIISSLLMPSEALWKRAAYEMREIIVDAIGFSPFTSASIPSPLMVIYAGIYAVFALILALWSFQKRDF
jgi:ABC-type transport system involved in multi-copper enzyme maturation permease subunit